MTVPLIPKDDTKVNTVKYITTRYLKISRTWCCAFNELIRITMRQYINRAVFVLMLEYIPSSLRTVKLQDLDKYN